MISSGIWSQLRAMDGGVGVKLLTDDVTAQPGKKI